MKVRTKYKRGGGVCLLIKNGIKFELNKEINSATFTNLEVVAINLITGSIKTTIISIYRPPHTDADSTMNDLEKLLSLVGSNRTIITGDTNIDTSNRSNITLRYLSKLRDYNMNQKTAAYTRITQNSKSIIDHVITNIQNLTTLVTYHCAADHQAVIACWGKKSKRDSEQNIIEKEINNISTNKKIHYKKTAEKIRQQNWIDWDQKTQKKSVDEIYNSFNNILKESIVEIEQKTKKHKLHVEKPYITSKILNERKSVQKARKKFIKNQSESNEKTFKELKKEYNKTLLKARNNYFGNKLKNAGKNSKLVWEVINEALNRKKKDKTDIDKLEYNDTVIEDKQQIANTLCDYYKNIAFDKIQKIKSGKKFEDYLEIEEKKENTFQLKPITKLETWQCIKSTVPKTSSGEDKITSKLVHMAAAPLTTPMNTIINACIQQGSFPNALKISKITPMDKRKGATGPSKYRPLNNLSTFSKIIEKPIIDQLEKHTQSYEDHHQFGYKKQHSTEHPILLTRHFIETELQKNKFVIVLMIDLTIAFETICTGTILPKKIQHYGGTAKTVNFFKEYFQNRKHYVELPDGTKSKTVTLHNYSCVQGSRLGPKIFNYYTHDIQNVIKKRKMCHVCSRMICFCDDTNIIISGKNLDEVVDETNELLHSLSLYMNSNCLIINKEKSSYMLLKPKNKNKTEIKKKITLEKTEIVRVHSARFLGIILDDKLNFKEQYERLLQKLTDAVNALIQIRLTLNYRAKMNIYHALFHSHLQYGALTYMDKLKKQQINRLYQLQKKAIRLVFAAPIGAHTTKLFKLSKIIPLNKIFETEAIKFVFKNLSESHKDQQPKAIQKLFEKNNNRITRTDQFLKLKYNKGAKHGNIMHSLIKTWNSENDNIKSAGNIYSLKKLQKETATDQMKECTTNNCKICEKDKNRQYENYMNK